MLCFGDSESRKFNNCFRTIATLDVPEVCIISLSHGIYGWTISTPYNIYACITYTYLRGLRVDYSIWKVMRGS